jgi:hypothetical protein
VNRKDYGVLADTLDYYIYWKFTNGTWDEIDSLANAYDTDGNLLEIYSQQFASDTRSRYRFNYRQNITTGIEPDASSPIAVYPNPTDGKLTIETHLINYTAHIYSVNGNLVGNFADAGEIDISGLTAGMYILLIESPGQNYWEKIIKY